MTNWIKYQYRKLLRPRTITNGSLRLFLGDHASSSYARSLYRDSHEADERAIITRHLQPGDTVLECGAGLGVITILCCQKVGSDRVWAYEANRRLEPILRQNFALNRVTPHLEMKMVSLHDGPQPFHVAERFIISSRYQPPQVPVQTEHLQAVSLPQLIRRIRPSFLIMDIEGGEMDLAEADLDLSPVQKLCIEVHPDIVGDEAVSHLVASLIGRGFQWHVGESRGQVLFFSRRPARLQASA